MLEIEEKEIEDILFDEGLISISQFKEAWNIKISSNRPILEVMLELGITTKKDIAFAKSKKLDFGFIDLVGYEFEDKDVPILITESMARNYCCIPLKIEENLLLVAMKDPEDLYALDDLTIATKYQIKPIMSCEGDIETLIDSIYRTNSETEPDQILEDEPDPASILADDTELDEVAEGEAAPESVSTDEVAPASILVDESGFINNIDKEKIKEIIDNQNTNNSPIFKSKLGRLLIKSGVLTQEKLEEALKIQADTGEKLGTVLVKEGLVPQEVMYRFLEAQLDIVFIDLADIDIQKSTISLVKENLARRYNLIPVEIEGDVLKVAMTDPSNVFTLDDLRLSTGMEIVPLLADEGLILEKLDYYYGKKEKPVETGNALDQEGKQIIDESIETHIEINFDEEMKKVNEEIAVEINMVEDEDDLSDLSEVSNAPIVKMVNIIFQKAIANRASDIHIEPNEDCVVVRYRVDGQLIEMMRHDKKILSPLVARIKIISALNIAEKRIPQDGRISITINKKNYDMRVSTLPQVHGEKVVIRIADKEAFNVTKQELGFFEDDLEKFNDIMDNPHGIVLVTGPTGSGKSTTLYTALRELSKPNVNILTVEDPVECTIRGINQVQVNAKAGLTFGTALRAFLRQDPDIIMVGEIRDGETAEIATRAAITGHLVLSTLHTNDAASSITRIIDMGIEPFVISSSIVGVIAQRLVRRLCPECKTEHILDVNEKNLLKIDSEEDVTIFEPKGCNSCNNSGYRGRIAIYEIMNIPRELREMIAKNVTSDTLKEKAISLGMKTLRDNCRRLVTNGTTSMDEMLRVTYSKD